MEQRLLSRFKPASVKLYLRQVKNVWEHLGFDGYHPENFRDIKLILDSLERYKMATKLSIINSIIRVLEADEAYVPDIIDEYKRVYKEMREEFSDEYAYREPSQVELESYMTWEQVVGTRDELMEKACLSPEDYQKYLLLALYTYIPPLRGDEYLNCRYVWMPEGLELTKDAEVKTNVMDLTHGKFLIRYSKTSRKYGPRILLIPPELLEVLRESYWLNQSDIVLPLMSKMNQAMSPPQVTKLFNEIFRTRLSTSGLRKVYISHHVPSMTVPERKTLARVMGHSVSSQELVYCRFEDPSAV